MIKVIAIGKIKDNHLNALIDDYAKKINKYHKFEIIEVKDEPIRDNDAKTLDIEADRALKMIDEKDYVVLLDLHGKMIDSIKLAEMIDATFTSYPRICFVIGGSLGLGKALLERANYRLKLSDMTFLHSITRLLIIEQIYRAFKILNNEHYHK